MEEVAKSTPLCLPNNLTWDPDTGKIQKVRSARGSLCVVPAAIEMLQKIKDPVCVVAITGPYRIGKSYILGEVFGQMEVFSIGHAMDPETLGIWMWIVPEKFKDTRGRDFRVILLDSEGISSVQTEDGDDNQIFTLSVLLASLLIYNSKGVPERTDLDKLKFIAKLAQRIRYHSKEGQNDQEFFRNTFPFFVWLLRDKTQKIPEDCRDLNHFFSTRVFKESPASTASVDEKSRQKVAESILNYFSGFESFALPMPSVDEDVMQDISKSKDKLNVKFLKEVQRFESLLKSKMAPKRSINPGEFVTGEALAMLVELYTAAINDQNLMPNVEAAWDTYVKKKCSEAEEKALKIYDEVMTGLMASQLPCDGEEIQRNHEKTQRQSMEAFEEETANLNSTIIDKEWKQLTKSVDERLGVWTDQNAALTQNSCEHLLRRLKAQHLDPVLERVCGPSGAQVNYSEIMNGWSMIKTDFDLKAVGARDVKADVFFDFNKGLQEEVMKYEEILKKMKDYDKDLSKEKIARAYQEKEKRRLEEHIAQLKKQEEGWKRKMEKLEKRQQQDLDAIKEQAKVDKEEWSKQMKMMREADMKTQAQLQKQLDTAIDREKQANRAMADTRKALDETRKEAEASRVAADQYWKDVESKITETTKMFQDQLKLSADRERQSTKVINDMIRMREDDQKVVASLRGRIQSLDDQLKDATKPGFIRRIWRAIFN